MTETGGKVIRELRGCLEIIEVAIEAEFQVAEDVVVAEEDSFEEDEVGAVVVEEKGEVSMIEAVARKEARIGSVEAVDI